MLSLKKAIALIITTGIYLNCYAQEDETFNTLTLTKGYDQLKFEPSSTTRYWIMSKPGDNRAFAFFSPDDGGFFTTWYKTTGNMVMHKGKLGIQTSPAAFLHVTGNNSNSVPLVRLHDISGGTNSIDINWNSAIGGYLKTNGNQDFVLQHESTGNVGIGVIPTQKLDVNGSILSRGGIYANGTDFKLGLNNGRDKGIKTSQRALVHFTLDRLYLNFDGDFEGGVRIQGPKTIIDGKVGVGTVDPKNELSVNGTIWAKEVKVSLTDAADWVFEDDYELRSLDEVETFVKNNKHLPEIPSAEEFRQNDLNVAEMNNKLLQKIEELTLYLIDQNKKIEELQYEVLKLKSE